MTKQKRRLYLKLIILLICVIIVFRIFTLAYAKYMSVGTANLNLDVVDVAFYLLNTGNLSMSKNLPNVFPQQEVFTYNFSVGNEKNNQIATMDIQYNITIKATTNIPITYELYKNETYNTPGATNIITSTQNINEGGVPKKQMNTANVTLVHSQATTNIYQLVMKFPTGHQAPEYQGTPEMIEIKISATSVV